MISFMTAASILLTGVLLLAIKYTIDFIERRRQRSARSIQDNSQS